MADWQPIETAPKDGKAILGYDGKYMATVYWRKYFAADGGEWCLVLCGAYAESSEWEPKFWLPLPEPPKGEKTDG